MNTILQKRIEEKSKELAQKYFPNEMNIWARPNYEAQYVESACKEISTFTLQNQWISVEEVLPPKDENIKYTDTSIRVLVRLDFDGEISHRTAIYSYALHKWSQYDKFVTHWMEIPSLGGGEE